MNQDDIAAVKKCITEKWHIMSKPEFYDDYDGIHEPECALCTLHAKRSGTTSNCVGCVIHTYTGCNGCGDTPYEEWSNVADNHEDASEEAKDEVAFLLKFLPKGAIVKAKDGTRYIGTGEAYDELTAETKNEHQN